jgi:hypothetical protein
VAFSFSNLQTGWVHKKNSPFGYGIVKSKKKHIDDINTIILSIGLNGFMKNLYMNIKICSCGINGVG